MIEVGSYDAKTRLPELLKKVQEGEHIIITKHAHPIAMIIPVSEKRKKPIKDTIEELKNYRKRKTTKGLSLKKMIQEGRS